MGVSFFVGNLVVRGLQPKRTAKDADLKTFKGDGASWRSKAIGAVSAHLEVACAAIGLHVPIDCCSLYPIENHPNNPVGWFLKGCSKGEPKAISEDNFLAGHLRGPILYESKPF